MKNENVMKINKLGKVSRILIIIFKVSVIIAIVACIVGSLLMLLIPDDSIRISGNASAEIVVESGIGLEKIIDIDESEFNSSIIGIGLKWILRDNGTIDGNRIYTLDAALTGVSANHIKASFSAALIAVAVYLALFFVILCFANKFAVALEECNSPFEENVIKRMKNFGISLIPWAAIAFFASGYLSGIVILLIVFVVLLFMSIFKYGAQLQQESDETL